MELGTGWLYEKLRRCRMVDEENCEEVGVGSKHLCRSLCRSGGGVDWLKKENNLYMLCHLVWSKQMLADSICDKRY